MNNRFLLFFLLSCGLVACSAEPGEPPATVCGEAFPCPSDAEVNPETNVDEEEISDVEDAQDEDSDSSEDADVKSDFDTETIGSLADADPDTNDNDTNDVTEDIQEEDVLAPGTCNVANDCPGFQMCAEGLCVSARICLTDGDCTEDLVCNRGTCSESITGCSQDDDCESGVCSPILKECISANSCSADEDCLSDICTDGVCTGCTKDTQCPAPSLGCNTKSGLCIEPATCTEANDCLPGKECSEDSCSWPVLSVDPYEPNNAWEVATEVEEDWNKEPLTLQEQDQDYFVFNVPAGHALVILVEFADRNTTRKVELRDATGNHLFSAGSPEASYALLTAPTAAEGRSCRLLIEQLGEGNSSYTITTWMLEKLACGEDAADLLGGNDQPGLGTDIQSASTQSPTGVICGNNPDWFTWETGTEGNGVVSLTYPSDLSDLRVRVFDESITLVEEGTPVGDSIGIQLDELPAGTHYIQVDSPTGSNAPYQLQAKAYGGTSCMIDEAELNDSLLSASPLGNGETSLTLCPDEEDWYQIQTPPNSGIIAGISYSNVSAQLVIELFDSEGNSLVENKGSVMPQGAVEQNVEWGEINGTMVYARVKRVSEAPVANFTPYKLTINTVDSFCVDDEYEDNDTPETAEETLTFQGLYMDGVSCKDDLDWFKVPVTDDEIISVDLLNLDDTGDSILLLLQPDGINALEGAAVQSVLELGQHASFAVADLPELSDPWIYALISSGSGNQYRLTTTAYSIPNDCVDDTMEPNNTMLGSVIIPPSGVVEGLFCPNNPDVFALAGSFLDSAIVLNLDIPEDNQQVNISIMDSKGDLVNYFTLSESGTIPLEIPPENSGPVFIQLLSSYSTSYSLTVGD